MTELPQRVRARPLIIKILHICGETYVSFLDSRPSFTIGVGLVIYPASSQAAAAVNLLGSEVSCVGEIVIPDSLWTSTHMSIGIKRCYHAVRNYVLCGISNA